MNRQKENINLLIGKVGMICLFLFLIFFKNTDYSERYFFRQSTPIPIVNVIEVDHSVAFVASTSSPNFYSSFVACEILTLNACNQNHLAIICSNNKINQLLKNCKEQFIIIKPRIIDLDSFHIQTSLNNEEISSIS
jgi:hypothetical protein